MVLHQKNDSFSSTTATAAASNKVNHAFLDQIELSTSTTVSSVEPTIVDIFPYGTKKGDLHAQGYYGVKVVHWIRHAQGFHNVGDARSRANIDARLTPMGESQCQALARKIQKAASSFSRYADVLHNTEMIVTSPVTRCIQTAILSLKPVLEKYEDVAVVAHECIRETVNFNCDRRRPINEIAIDFPLVDFSLCDTNEDAIWEYYESLLGDDEEFTENRESAEIHTIAERTRSFFEWLSQRPEEHVAVCCHATVSRCIFNFGLSGGNTPTDVPQTLDTRLPEERMDIPVVNFCGDAKFAEAMRRDFQNCELRSMVMAFKWR